LVGPPSNFVAGSLANDFANNFFFEILLSFSISKEHNLGVYI